MANRKLGQLYLVERVYGHAWCYFAGYCPKCREKIYLDRYDFKEFRERSYMNSYRLSFYRILKSKVALHIPRIRIIIEKREVDKEKNTALLKRRILNERWG